MKMIANRAMTYGTRRLRPNDEFPASRRDADLLRRLGRARYAETAAPAPAEDMTELRRDYERIVGKRPFPGWDADELKRRMAEAKD